MTFYPVGISPPYQISPESLLPQNKEHDSFSQQLSIDWTSMWPGLLWGQVCQKNPEAEFYLSKEVSATEGLEASRYVEDGYLYTIPKLA